ncbi:MAG: SGNH/GDSL hydrolase family protein [Sandaracinaceae bacterium]|nr:SGNH/GDSL hydrolase family protein [Sandaracinaceae bacterium]
MLAVAALGCGSEGGPAMPEVAPELAAPVAQAPEPEPAPPEPGVRIEPIPELSVLTASLVEHLRAIRATSDRRQDDVFMKVGDSSTVSRGFLECFSSPDEVDLAGREELEATLAHFRNRHAGSRDSYRRVSRAAHEGWSARHVLDGDPSPLLQEVRAIRPRFAFVMNGGNDVEGADDYRYAQRMLRIVEGLEANGVIPILSAISPRRDDPETERWVERYNTVGWAIARARRLPYLDYHQLMMRLPRLGLAGDGVHPNIYPVDGRGRACVLDEAGLQYGHNARNLLALRGLDATRRAALEGADGSPDPPVEGDGTAASPREVRALPFAELVDTRTGGSRSIDRYACGDADESGREIVYRLVVDRPLAVRLLAVGREDVDVDVHLLRGEATGAACVERADREIEATLEPGTWLVSVDTFSEGGEARAGEALVVLSPRVEGPHGLD